MNYASDFFELYSKCGNNVSGFVSVYNGNKYNLMQSGFRALDGVNASLYEAEQLLKSIANIWASYKNVQHKLAEYGESSAADNEELASLVDFINTDIEKIKQRNREIKAGLKNEMIAILEDAWNGAPFSGSMLHRKEMLEFKVGRVLSTKLKQKDLFGADAIDEDKLKKDLKCVVDAFNCSKDGLKTYMDSLKDPFSDKNLGMYATDEQIAALTPEERATIRQYKEELNNMILRGLNHLTEPTSD